MKHHSLSTKGLSLSQAQSISNVLNQRALEIQAQIDSFNACGKTVKIAGETYVLQSSNPVSDLVSLIKTKAKFYAVQAFLMENIKAKDELMNQMRQNPFETKLIIPQEPDYESIPSIVRVTETWGWEQLSSSELEEYYEVEAMASHIGQLIHKSGKLTELRKQINELPSIEWITIKDGERTPVVIQKNTTSKELLAIHEQLAVLHREYEQRVNYFKAKVKNLITEENARLAREQADKIGEIQKRNTILREQFNAQLSAYYEALSKEQAQHNAKIEDNVKSAVALRIAVPERFKGVIDEIMPTKES